MIAIACVTHKLCAEPHPILVAAMPHTGGRASCGLGRGRVLPQGAVAAAFQSDSHF